MTTEPRQEAAQLVDDVTGIYGMLDELAPDAAREQLGISKWSANRDRLVDVLAAAIEVSRANPVPRSVPLHRLNEALSALREHPDG